MIREIKFRVWCKQYEQFIQFNKMIFLEDGSLWYVQGVDENEKEIDPPYFENQNDWELMQYTGLKDKNGVEIYEGDIVRCFRDGPSEVVFKKGCFGLETYIAIGNYYSTFDEVYGYCEIIGNIYENPELLEREPQ